MSQQNSIPRSLSRSISLDPTLQMLVPFFYPSGVVVHPRARRVEGPPPAPFAAWPPVLGLVARVSFPY